MGARAALTRLRVVTALPLRRRAALVLWTEACVAAAAPALLLLLGYAALALFGLGSGWLCGVFLLLFALALGRGIAGIIVPDAARIDRRIEFASGLKHCPFAAAADTPAVGDALGAAIWAAHQRRVAAALAGARSGGPFFRAAARDPFALRGFVLLLFLTGLVVAGPAAPGRLATGFVLPSWPFAGPQVNAWITPPAYDPAPPLLLTPGQRATVLAGSRLAVIVNGPKRAPALSLGATSFATTALGPGSFRADAVLNQSGRLKIGPWWHRIGHWRITVVAPAPPSISLTRVELALNDPTHIRINWQAADPYGLAGINATLTPVMKGFPNALPENFTLNPAAHEARVDVADTPYAGLAMYLTLHASNVAGMTASSVPSAVILLSAPLHDRTAIALAAIRQGIALDPFTLVSAGMTLKKIAAFPPSLITFAADVKLAALAAQMTMRQIGAQAAVDRLGALIAEIEAGPDYAPAKALAQANAALMHALEQGLNGKPVDSGSLQKLLQAMHQAMARHMAAAGQPAATMQGLQTIDMQDLDRLARQIAADEAAGKTAQAAREMQQLQAAMDAVQNARPMSAGEAAQAQAAAQAAQALAQLTTGEATLLDDTHNGTAGPGAQDVLKNQLNAIQHGLLNAHIPLPGLGEAGQAMDNARRALAAPDAGQAEAAEGKAIQDLQKAAAALAAAQPKLFSLGQGSSALPQENPAGESANGAPDEQADPNLGVRPPNPADAIERQIIKQDAKPGLPAADHQYFRRLLNPDE